MTKLVLQDVTNLQNESTVVTALTSNNNATEVAMENTLSRDGTTPNQMLSNLDMNNYKIINLPDALTDQEPATYSQLTDALTAISAGAVVSVPYVTLANNPTLLNERVLTAGSYTSLTDSGPNGTITVDVSDPELVALAGTISAADKVPYYTGFGTATTSTLSSYGRTLIDDADATTARATLGSVIGTNVQAWDTDLDAVAGLATTGLISRTGAGTATTRTLTGTANEITSTNGDGISGNPTVSLPSALTFTGKTVTGGTYNSPALVTPALGTPASGVATNLTGTAAGLTAGNVTTNANLTGPITSVGNATSIASQTGTGTKFVVDTTPTLVTPVLGVATATSVNKVAITAPATSATLTIPDGVTLTGPAASGTAMTLGNTETVTGVKTFGSAGAVGRLKLAGTTSGSTVLDASATASGTLTLPAATDTLIGKATTDTLTNKTYDTAGTGNSFSINGVAATANTGTGSVVRATSPALVTPALGVPTALTLTNATGLPLSGLNTQGAYTIVANNSGSSAVPTAMDVTSITSKPAPISGDIVLIQDSAASNAFKRTTVGALASAGSVASYEGRTGAVTAQASDRVNLYAAPFDALNYNGMQINGSMDVDQEHASAAVTGITALGGNGAYVTDGWRVICAGTNVETAQQVADAPPGYSNSLKVTVTTAESSIGASSFVGVAQRIEGYRTYRLAFGTASAQSLSIGFWTKIHRIGTYSGAISNGALNRSYAFSFTQNVADVWEYKTVTITGDTSGTWLVTNGVGLNVSFMLAAGSTFVGTAGTWTGTQLFGVTGTTNGVAATSDVFQITGVVILPGTELPSSSRASLVMRPYDQELPMCKRYLRIIVPEGVGAPSSTTQVFFCLRHDGMRIAPSSSATSLITVSDIAAGNFTQSSASATISGNTSESGLYIVGNLTGLTTFRPYMLTAGSIKLDARL